MNVKKEIDIFSLSDNLRDKNDVKDNADSDYIEETIGAAGYWQVGIAIIAASSRCTAMVNMTSLVFLTPITDFVCTEFKDNVTIEAENGTCYENCSTYVFHSDVMETSLISDFGLICEKAWLGSFTQTVLMFGLVLGAPFFGWISDRFGRRPALISSTFLNVISMIPASFAPNYWTFTFLRFISGFASGGTLLICLPIFMEIVGKKHREAAGGLSLLPDGISEASLVLFAYFLPKWTTFLLGFCIVGLLIFILTYFIPESPRWLISNGKVDKAIDGLTRAAKFNNLSTVHIRDIVERNVEAMKIKENETVAANYSEFFKTKRICIVTASILFIWTVTGISYYGIYQYMTLLGLDVFVTVAIMALIQIPLYPVGIIINKIFSRKMSIFGISALTGITMIILIFTPNDHWTTTMFGVIGFSASSVNFVVLYVYLAELYPTPLRTMAYGISSATCKIGAMIAPFIANITPVWIPSTIFAVLSLTAALSVYVLPETKGRNLKDVVD